jgi:hypothetical protein
VTALLGKTCVVNDDDPLRIVKGFAYDSAVRLQHGLLIPGALIDELLQRLLRIAVPAGHADAGTQRLDALALTIQEQALQVDTRPTGARDLTKATSELGDVVLGTLENVRLQFHHRCPRHLTTLRLVRKPV